MESLPAALSLFWTEILFLLTAVAVSVTAVTVTMATMTVTVATVTVTVATVTVTVAAVAMSMMMVMMTFLTTRNWNEIHNTNKRLLVKRKMFVIHMCLVFELVFHLNRKTLGDAHKTFPSPRPRSYNISNPWSMCT